jgi:hypothetical protein
VRESGTVYCLPVGPGDLGEVIPLLRGDAARHGAPLAFYGLNEGDLPRLEQACPGAFRFETRRGSADYIYRREDLALLAGKKYHQKRNHAARFEREYGWRYEEITSPLLEECHGMLRRWAQRNSDKNPEALRQEQTALERCFAHYESFGLRGGLLRVDGQVIAFTLGEALNAQTFCTHFEKADTQYAGAYQMIHRCFAQHSLGGFEFVHREEDLGDEGLRKAKLSYQPALLLEKYTATEQKK